MGIKTTRHLWALALGLSALAGVMAWRNLPASIKPTSLRSVGTAGEELGAIPLTRRPLAYYQNGFRTDLMDAPQSEPQKTAPSPPPVLQEKAVPIAQSTPAPDPLADYDYTGWVTLNGRTYALIEHRTTREAFYLKEGDTFQGFTVGPIGTRNVTLNAPGADRMLARNEDYSLTPLTTKGRSPRGDQTQVAVNHDTTPQVETSYVRMLNFTENGSLVSFKLTDLSLNGVNVEQIHNDVFEGKMTQEEANQRIGSSGGYKVLLGNYVNSVRYTFKGSNNTGEYVITGDRN